VSLRGIAFVLSLAAPLGALADGAFTSLHPEDTYPDPTQAASADPYSGFISGVQEKLRELGFDAGPANGDFSTKTQAALGQFQLSRDLPASGQLDDRTLAELGVTRETAQASAGATTEPAANTENNPESDTGAKPGG
jgi:peptidoglycan hydrolase-like protein with peptidoglycan-binding domain